MNNEANNPVYNEYDEIDLRELIMVIWDNKWLIFAITSAVVLIAGIYSFFIAVPVYETSSEIYTPDYQLINGTELTNDEYLSFFKNPEIKQQLINKYNLDITMDGMDGKLSISADKEKNNVGLKISDVDNDLSADLLNEWVRLFSVEVENYMSGINNNYMDKIESLMTTRESLYIETENKLTEFEKNTNLSLIKARLNTRNSKLVAYENRLLSLKNDITILEEKNRLLKQQLQNTKEFIVTNETINDSSMEVLADLFKGNGNLQSLITKKESINDIYLTIQRQRNQADLDLVTKREEIELINKDIVVMDEEIVVLKEKVATLEERQRLLNLRLSEARQNYQNTENLYNSLVQDLEKEDYNITVISKAVVPEAPVSPRKLLNLAIAGVLGIFISIFIVFAKNLFIEKDLSESIAQ